VHPIPKKKRSHFMGALSGVFDCKQHRREHPLMRRFHKPGDEKLSVVIIRPGAYEDWLSCRSTDEARSFLQLYPADEMHAEPFPLPPRASKTKSTDEGQESLLY
jgi:hypothetical protein